MSESVSLATVANGENLKQTIVESPSPMSISGGGPISAFVLGSVCSSAHEDEELSMRQVTWLQAQQPSVDFDLDGTYPVVDEPDSISNIQGSVRRRSRRSLGASLFTHHVHSVSVSSDPSVSSRQLYSVDGYNASPVSLPEALNSPVVSLSKTSVAWDKCSKRLRKHDQRTVKGWKEDIDTLLVLAGLLSAVITAFNIESYQMLQPTSEDLVASILQQILVQLSNSSLSPVTPTPPQSPSAVRINILWFSSLVFSLTAALIGILVKQWLRDYLSSFASSPRERARVRQFRHQGLIGWYIPEIIALLPVFLQLALAFFFLGLLDLLWTLNRVVAGIVSVFVAASLLFLVITTILPATYEGSPHRSPQALAIFSVGQRLRKVAGIAALLCFKWLGWTRVEWPLNMSEFMFRSTRRRLIAWAREVAGVRSPRSWIERERVYVQKHANQPDHFILSGADAIFMDDSFLEKVVRVCVNDTATPEALACLCDILENRSHGSSEDGTPLWKPYEMVDKGFATLMHLVADILHRIDTRDQDGILRVLRILDKLCKAMPFETETPEARKLYQRIYSVLARLLYHTSDIQRTAFNLMRDLFGRSIAPIDGVVIESILSFARTTRRADDDHMFHVACSMVLSFAHTDLSQGAYQNLRGRLKEMLDVLEGHLSDVLRSTLPDRPTPSPSLLVALLDIAAVDPELVGNSLVETLNTLITGTTYGPAGSEASLQANHVSKRAGHYLNLRRAYGRTGPRRQDAVLVENLDDLGLSLPS